MRVVIQFEEIKQRLTTTDPNDYKLRLDATGTEKEITWLADRLSNYTFNAEHKKPITAKTQ